MSIRDYYFQLLEYSNKLRKEKRESFDRFLKFSVTIETNLNYSEKQYSINLAKDFLDNQLTADDFSYSFMAIYQGISQKLSQMERSESVELANFLEPNRPELGDLLAQIYSACDAFSPDPEIAMSDEKELKDYAKILLSKLQEE